MIKVVRNMKSFKILLKNFLMTDKVKFEIAHSAKNCLDIDTDSDEPDEDLYDQVDTDIKEMKQAKKLAFQQQSRSTVLQEFHMRKEVGGGGSANDRLAMLKNIQASVAKRKAKEAKKKKQQENILGMLKSNLGQKLQGHLPTAAP